MLIKSDAPLCTENNIISATAFKVSETLMRCAKESRFFKLCSHKMNKFLIQNINFACDIHAFFISRVKFCNIYFSCQVAVKILMST